MTHLSANAYLATSTGIARSFGYWLSEFGSYVGRSFIKCVIRQIWNVVFGLFGIMLARTRNLSMTQPNESFQDYITQGTSNIFTFIK